MCSKTNVAKHSFIRQMGWNMWLSRGRVKTYRYLSHHMGVQGLIPGLSSYFYPKNKKQNFQEIKLGPSARETNILSLSLSWIKCCFLYWKMPSLVRTGVYILHKKLYHPLLEKENKSFPLHKPVFSPSPPPPPGKRYCKM